MKKIWIFTLVFIISITACYSCKSDNKDKNNDIDFSEDNKEAQDKEFYTLSDFEGIVIGKSTLDDVLKVGMYTYNMSPDAKVEYPSYDNSYIQIQFDEKGIVSDIITQTNLCFQPKNTIN